MVVPNYCVRYLHGEIESSINGDEALNTVNFTLNVGQLPTFVQMVYDGVGP